jgi:hypothetical protein
MAMMLLLSLIALLGLIPFMLKRFFTGNSASTKATENAARIATLQAQLDAEMNGKKRQSVMDKIRKQMRRVNLNTQFERIVAQMQSEDSTLTRSAAVKPFITTSRTNFTADELSREELMKEQLKKANPSMSTSDIAHVARIGTMTFRVSTTISKFKTVSTSMQSQFSEFIANADVKNALEAAKAAGSDNAHKLLSDPSKPVADDPANDLPKGK